MTALYEVTAHYATWAGNSASCRRIVAANNHEEALELVSAKVRKFKRFMGRLDMESTLLRQIEGLQP